MALVDPLQDPGARRYPVTRPFGDTSIVRVGAFNNIGPHTGIDRAPANGYPVVAAAAGVARRAGWTVTGGGREVDIVHSDRLETRYMHLSAVTVPRDTMVRAGQVIGAVGSTGAALGPHLHFEVLLDGAPVDPAPYLGIGGGQLAAVELLGKPVCATTSWQTAPEAERRRLLERRPVPPELIARGYAPGDYYPNLDCSCHAANYVARPAGLQGLPLCFPAEQGAGIPGVAAGVLGEALHAVVTIGANLVIVVTGLVLVVGGAREALRS